LLSRNSVGQSNRWSGLEAFIVAYEHSHQTPGAAEVLLQTLLPYFFQVTNVNSPIRRASVYCSLTHYRESTSSEYCWNKWVTLPELNALLDRCKSHQDLPTVFLGIGLNLNSTEFSHSLADKCELHTFLSWIKNSSNALTRYEQLLLLAPTLDVMMQMLSPMDQANQQNLFINRFKDIAQDTTTIEGLLEIFSRLFLQLMTLGTPFIRSLDTYFYPIVRQWGKDFQAANRIQILANAFCLIVADNSAEDSLDRAWVNANLTQESLFAIWMLLDHLNLLTLLNHANFLHWCSASQGAYQLYSRLLVLRQSPGLYPMIQPMFNFYQSEVSPQEEATESLLKSHELVKQALIDFFQPKKSSFLEQSPGRKLLEDINAIGEETHLGDMMDRVITAMGPVPVLHQKTSLGGKSVREVYQFSILAQLYFLRMMIAQVSAEWVFCEMLVEVGKQAHCAPEVCEKENTPMVIEPDTLSNTGQAVSTVAMTNSAASFHHCQQSAKKQSACGLGKF